MLAKRRALVPRTPHPLPPLTDIQLRETPAPPSDDLPPVELDDPDALVDP